MGRIPLRNELICTTARVCVTNQLDENQKHEAQTGKLIGLDRLLLQEPKIRRTTLIKHLISDQCLHQMAGKSLIEETIGW